MGTELNVALLLGGPSAEREVSLQSGECVARALESLGHHVYRVDPIPGALSLPADTDVVFLALHGGYGEDGAVQTELENLNFPYTGCGAEASRLAFDKVKAKERFIEHNISTPNFSVVNSADATLPRGLALPLILKPVCQGSSVGLEFIDDADQWNDALERSLKSGDRILVEERFVGREVTVSILAGEPLPVVEVRPEGGRYDYHNKYHANTTKYLCPAPFPDNVTRRIQQIGHGAFLAVGGRDYGRVDIMVSENGEPSVLEVNTLPGMTDSSLLPKAAAAAGVTYPKLCQRMLDLALQHQSCSA